MFLHPTLPIPVLLTLVSIYCTLCIFVFYYFMCFTVLTAFIDHVRLLRVFSNSWKLKDLNDYWIGFQFPAWAERSEKKNRICCNKNSVRVATNLENVENLEYSGISLNMENSGNSRNSVQHQRTRKPSWRKGYARQQCVYTASLDFWNSKVAPLVRTSPNTLP